MSHVGGQVSAMYLTPCISPYTRGDLLSLFPLMIYGIIFWGNSTCSDNIFRLQKRIIRIIMGVRTRDSCGELFKIVKLIPLTSQYIFSLALFVDNNGTLFMEYSELHNIKTRNNANVFQPSSHLTVYQEVQHYFGIKVHNKLPF
jgi:hypothetical protein